MSDHRIDPEEVMNYYGAPLYGLLQLLALLDLRQDTHWPNVFGMVIQLAHHHNYSKPKMKTDTR